MCIRDSSKTGEVKKYLVALSKQILVQENDYVRAGTCLLYTSVIAYIKESYDELVHKVSWPTYSELANSAVVVLYASLLIASSLSSSLSPGSGCLLPVLLLHS